MRIAVVRLKGLLQDYPPDNTAWQFTRHKADTRSRKQQKIILKK